ncbi:MAG: hypothetical protein WDO16_07810 [Bacteroidota bacterium]
MTYLTVVMKYPAAILYIPARELPVVVKQKKICIISPAFILPTGLAEAVAYLAVVTERSMAARWYRCSSEWAMVNSQ